MHAILQADKPDCYVLATNRSETIREFLKMSFNAANIDIEFSGSEDSEVAINSSTGDVVVSVNPAFYRPAEVELLIGNAQKAKDELGWEPKTKLEDLCKMMVRADIIRNSSENKP